MPFRPLAALLLVTAASAAPWMAGANTTLPLGGWWLGVPLAGAFILVFFSRLQRGASLQIPRLALAAASFLVGCLVWWIVSPAPRFATAFSAEHWQFLEAKYPFVMLHWPRAGLIFFLATALLGFLASVELGSDEAFRRNLCETIGLTGLVIALYALGIRWFGWTTPTWIQLPGDTEQFNVSFFHHNAPGACLNLAWPLLLFSKKPILTPTRTLITSAGLLAIVAAALPLWHSKTAPLLAAGLLALGLAWRHLASKGKAKPWMVPGTVAAFFFGIFAWQACTIFSAQSKFPDHWLGAVQTQQDAPARDAAMQAAANLRGDHLVASPMPPRPAAWLTALRMAKDYPLVGLGPGAWVTHAVLYSNDTIVNTFYQHRQFAHHDLLQTAAEWGGLGLLAWLVLWIGAFYLAPRRDSVDPTADMGLVLSLLGIALHSTVHFPLQNPAVLLWAVLLLGLAWSRSSRAQLEPSNR